MSEGLAGNEAAFAVPAAGATPFVPDLTPSVNVIVGAVVAVAESLVNSSVDLVKVMLESEVVYVTVSTPCCLTLFVCAANQAAWAKG